MIAYLLLILCSFVTDRLSDSFEIWERNTVRCEETGKVNLVQHVWWRLEEHDGIADYYVAAWRLDEKDVTCQPQKTDSGWCGVFVDNKDGARRVVSAKMFIETESTVDYERVDSERLPTERRRGLKQQGAGM